MKDLNEIRDDYDKGKYTAILPKTKKVGGNKIYDIDESVKWNKEKARSENQNHIKNMEEYRSKIRELTNKLRSDVTKYIVSLEIPNKSAKLIESKIWQDEHSNMGDYFLSIDDEAEYILTIIKSLK